MAISKVILDGETQMDVTQDTVTANSMLAGYSATRNDGEKIFGTIEEKDSSDISVFGRTVDIPEGYYSSSITTNIPLGDEGIPVATKSAVSGNSVTVTPSVTNVEGYIYGSTQTGTPVTVSASDLVSGSQTVTSNQTVDVTNLEEVVVDVQPNNQDKTINPNTSTQIVTPDTGYTGLGTVVVTAIQAGTEGTPIATKGAVSNHTMSVTPSVTNTEGYIYGSTVTGDPVTVSASELVSGSQTVTRNGTVDVTNLEELVVHVEGGDIINNQDKTVSPTLSQQTITADPGQGYTGLGTVTVNAMPAGTEGTPEADVTTDPTTQDIIVTPKVTNSAGYISGGLRSGTPVSIQVPVTSVNGQTGDVVLSIPENTSDLVNDSGFITDPGVTSFNGNTGAVTYTAPVTSVNGQTGDVTITAGVSSFNGQTGNVTYTAPVTSVNGQTGAVSISVPATPSAYVIAKGTSGSWTYRKWSDNTYECWMRKTFSVTIGSTWGSMYYGTTPAQSYPVTFKSSPYEIVSVSGGNFTAFVGGNSTNGPSTTATASYLLLRPTNTGNTDYILDFYVRGTV